MLDNKKITMDIALKIAKLSGNDQEKLFDYAIKYNVKLSKKLLDFILENINEIDLEEIVKSFIEDDKEEFISLKISKELLINKFGDKKRKEYIELVNELLK